MSKFFSCCICFAESAYTTLNVYHFIKFKKLIKA